MIEESENTRNERAWLWVVAPILFLITGLSALFGLYLSMGRNMKESNEVAIESEEQSEEEIVEKETKEKEEKKKEDEEQETVETPKESAPSNGIGPSPFAGNPQNANGTNSSTTYDAVGHVVNGVKYIYYKTMVWGTVTANFEDFRNKVAETLNDSRGWVRAGLKFVEVSEGQDLNIVLSDPASLEGYNGYCSGELSCTSGYNEVIINDNRWREGTDATTGSGLMSQRDYQIMVVNHEMGHWLGHYQHIEDCAVSGGVAPIMLQQSTGLRSCGAFNPWPLDDELWTLR